MNADHHLYEKIPSIAVQEYLDKVALLRRTVADMVTLYGELPGDAAVPRPLDVLGEIVCL